MIDLGESLLAVIGTRAVINRDVGHVTVDMWDKAKGLERRIDLLAGRLVRGELEGKVDIGPETDYRDMLDKLTTSPTTTELMAMIKSFPPEAHDAASAFLFTAGRAYNFAKQSFPISVERHLQGFSNLPPSDLAMAGFEFVLQVLDDPLYVFDLLDTWALLGGQVKALQACFPQVTAAVVSKVSDRIDRQVAEHADYVPHFQVAFAKLQGAPHADPQVTTALGAAKAAEDAQKQAQRQQRPQESRVSAMTAPPSSNR